MQVMINEKPYEMWAITLKYIKKDIEVAPSTYEPIRQLMITHGIRLEQCYYEPDSKGICHMHGIAYIPKGFLRKKICINGFHTKFVEIYDREGWIQYCKKNQKESFEKLFKPVETITKTEDDYDDPRSEPVVILNKRLF